MERTRAAIKSVDRGGRRAGVLAALGVLLVPLALLAQGESYLFTTGGVDDGPANFVDRFCGPDMLPYTDDDFDLPERGNVGGTWGFSWIDSDGDGQMAEEEKIFVVIRRGDDTGGDDVHTFSSRSYPEYGVLDESENWIDYHEARNTGPSASEPGDLSAEGDDFEHNDRPGRGERGWEDANNNYWFNNARPNQWGWGGSRYYFEHRNGAALDEIEGFNKWLSFQNNKDDPTTPDLNERGDCRNSYMRSLDAVTKGLLVPVADIPGLKDGDLDPLFGWYPGDMAKYVRDVIGPLLEDPSLKVYETRSGCGPSGLPATHLTVLQIECPIRINAYGDCGSPAAAEAQAAYWGIEPTTPGQPETAAVYRTSHLLLFNDALTPVEIGVRSFTTQPEDGVRRNLWLHDDYWRANVNDVGRYALKGGWRIADDYNFDTGCAQTDKLFLLPEGLTGHFDAPLSAPLDPLKGAIYAAVEFAHLEPAVPAAAGGGSPRFYQIILLDGDAVVASGEVVLGVRTAVHIGGKFSAEFSVVESPEATAEGPAADPPEIDPVESKFPRFVLRAGPREVKLLLAPAGEYTPNDYVGMETYRVLATLERGITGRVTAVRFAAGMAPLSYDVGVDTIALFQNLDPDDIPGLFLRGDTNNDRVLDLSDAVFALGHLFLGGPRWVCDEGADINADGKHDVSDAVYLLGFQFLGGAAPPAPHPACGIDPGGEICPLSKCNG